jgi:hypothetical protein
VDITEWERRTLIRKYGAIPDECPKCHASQIVRVVWKPAFYCGGPLGSAIRDGRAILVGADRPEDAPDWVCPTCEPGWEDVYLLTQEIETWQEKVESAVREGDFDNAIKYRDRREEVLRRRSDLVQQLKAARQPGWSNKKKTIGDA